MHLENSVAYPRSRKYLEENCYFAKETLCKILFLLVDILRIYVSNLRFQTIKEYQLYNYNR